MSVERRLRAPAKINLVLEVLGRRADGYHELDTVLQELTLADSVSLTFGAEQSLTVSGPWAAGVPLDERNIVWDAAAALAALAGRTIDGLALRIDKEIPPAAGLGGGSSDAVAVLRLLADAWDLGAGAVMEAAAKVGSDPPFFVRGGTARARGRGEIITPLESIPAHDVVLFVTPETIERKTARLFEALGQLPFGLPGVVDRFVAAKHDRITAANLSNSFERVAFGVFPGLQLLKLKLQGRLGAPVRLAGAGPTLFWIGPVGEGPRVARETAGLPCHTITTRTAA